MTSSRSRRNRNRRRTFNGNPADHDDTQWIGRLRTDDMDGTTWLPGPGLPGGIAYLAAVAVNQTGQDTQPLARLRAEPRYAPAPAPEYIEMDPGAPPLALPPGPVAAPAPASAEATEPAVIGDALRLPVIWCDMARCISWHHDPASAGYADTRERAAAAGWRYDARGLFACPECQQTRSDYRTPQPLAWHHKEVARRWNSGEPPGEETAFRLGVVAEYCRRINREHPEWAEAMAGATARQRRTAAS